MSNFTLIVVLVIMAFFAIGSFIIAIAEKRARIKEEKENKEHDKKAAEIITQANETKEAARSGNHGRDLNYMAGKLHDYATK